MPNETIVALVTVLPLLLGGVVAYRKQSKSSPETASTVAAAANTITEAAERMAKSLNQEIGRLKEVIDELVSLVHALEDEVVFLGGDPRRIRLQAEERRKNPRPE